MQKPKDATTRAISSLFNSKPTTLIDLSNKINVIDDDTVRDEIINTLFPYLKRNSIHTPLEIIEHDKEIAHLFDAFFTINTNNFFELFSGNKDILRYSAQINHSTDNNDRISIENFDDETGRAEFLTKCFNSRTINHEIYIAIKSKDKMAKPLSLYEKALIKFYSVAITEAPKLENLASSLLTKIKLTYDIKTKENFAQVVIAENKPVNELESKIKGFLVFLKNFLPKNDLQLKANKQQVQLQERQLQNNLKQAIYAQYLLSKDTNHADFQFDEFYDNLHDFYDYLDGTVIYDTLDNKAIDDCKLMVQYLISNKHLLKIYSNGERFNNITDVINDLAYFAHKQSRSERKVYNACFNLAKVMDLDNYFKNQDAWKTTWDKEIQKKECDYKIV